MYSKNKFYKIKEPRIRIEPSVEQLKRATSAVEREVDSLKQTVEKQRQRIQKLQTDLENARNSYKFKIVRENIEGTVVIARTLGGNSGAMWPVEHSPNVDFNPYHRASTWCTGGYTTLLSISCPLGKQLLDLVPNGQKRTFNFGARIEETKA